MGVFTLDHTQLLAVAKELCRKAKKQHVVEKEIPVRISELWIQQNVALLGGDGQFSRERRRKALLALQGLGVLVRENGGYTVVFPKKCLAKVEVQPGPESDERKEQQEGEEEAMDIKSLRFQIFVAIMVLVEKNREEGVKRGTLESKVDDLHKLGEQGIKELLSEMIRRAWIRNKGSDKHSCYIPVHPGRFTSLARLSAEVLRQLCKEHERQYRETCEDANQLLWALGPVEPPASAQDEPLALEDDIASNGKPVVTLSSPRPPSSIFELAFMGILYLLGDGKSRTAIKICKHLKPAARLGEWLGQLLLDMEKMGWLESNLDGEEQLTYTLLEQHQGLYRRMEMGGAEWLTAMCAKHKVVVPERSTITAVIMLLGPVEPFDGSAVPAVPSATPPVVPPEPQPSEPATQPVVEPTTAPSVGVESLPEAVAEPVVPPEPEPTTLPVVGSVPFDINQVQPVDLKLGSPFIERYSLVFVAVGGRTIPFDQGERLTGLKTTCSPGKTSSAGVFWFTARTKGWVKFVGKRGGKLEIQFLKDPDGKKWEFTESSEPATPLVVEPTSDPSVAVEPPPEAVVEPVPAPSVGVEPLPEVVAEPVVPPEPATSPSSQSTFDFASVVPIAEEGVSMNRLQRLGLVFDAIEGRDVPMDEGIRISGMEPIPFEGGESYSGGYKYYVDMRKRGYVALEGERGNLVIRFLMNPHNDQLWTFQEPTASFEAFVPAPVAPATPPPPAAESDASVEQELADAVDGLYAMQAGAEALPHDRCDEELPGEAPFDPARKILVVDGVDLNMPGAGDSVSLGVAFDAGDTFNPNPPSVVPAVVEPATPLVVEPDPEIVAESVALPEPELPVGTRVLDDAEAAPVMLKLIERRRQALEACAKTRRDMAVRRLFEVICIEFPDVLELMREDPEGDDLPSLMEGLGIKLTRKLGDPRGNGEHTVHA
ncbi:MAG: hypothetical protein US42_C0015G0025 [Candidatus Magasanikbacteria bacterium GW2011_GWC2_37_14]|uniref:Uncharacterized protein n=1 Tax=Candidatus Magasanikbacteria bacterium GW2011_GWC2_37_14 TaxID=1619046 RepID=A0A0G0GAV4_9BACT|nr:MAG: hypothetical protein US42_C0015G0025 [Candidatus Magasanikbacteria bacterium GW2011_GWC2_37_14]